MENSPNDPLPAGDGGKKMQVDLAAAATTNSPSSSSPRFWTAITQSVFRLKENSWLADEMTCFCLCHRRVAAADAAVALEK